MDDLITTFAEWVIGFVESVGYIGVVLLVILEYVFPPLPSEVVLPFSGFLVSRGVFSYPLVVLAAITGTVGGAFLHYSLARWLGEDRLRSLVKRHGRVVLLDSKDIDRAHGWFERHGELAVIVCQVVPLLRILISIPAGFTRMVRWRFILYTAIGGCVWNGVIIGLGWFLGEQWRLIEEYTEWLTYAGLAVLVALGAWLLWRRWGGSRDDQEPSRATD